ncbi:MAG: DNA recombination protein RmuC, partial [Planctomycetota bacterium]
MDALNAANLNPVVLLLAGLLLLALIFIGRQRYHSMQELKAKLIKAGQTELTLRDSLQNAERDSHTLTMELDKERALAAQKLEQFEQNRKQLKIEFENLAGKILDDKARSFDKTNKDSIESMLKPFREQVEGFQKRINDVHSESIKGNALLEGEIKKVLEVGIKMGSDAQNLTDALKGDSQKRGNWG